MKNIIENVKNKQNGAVGYVLAWAMGVPATILVVIYLLRGGN